jgi:imidazolonepropionase
MNRLLTNIHQLAGIRPESKLLRGAELAELPVIGNAFVHIRDGLIAGYGEMSAIGQFEHEDTEVIDAEGRYRAAVLVR